MLESKKRLLVYSPYDDGNGLMAYDGEVVSYSRDSCEPDMMSAVNELIRIGFISDNDVVICEGEEICQYLDF